MTRSPQFHVTHAALAALNDMIWFQQFAGHEVASTVKSVPAGRELDYTADIFTTNPFSSRCNIRLGGFDEFKKRQDQVAFSSTYSSSYEHLARHWQDLRQLLVDCGKNTWKAATGTKWECVFDDSLHNSGYPRFPTGLIDTCTYLRLRRNHQAHAAAVVGSGTLKFIAEKGSRLNRFWSSQAAVNQVDFECGEILVFRPAETLGLLRAMLMLVKWADAHIVPWVEPHKVVSYLVTVWLAETKQALGTKLMPAGVKPAKMAKNQMIVETLAKKFALRCWSEMKLKVPATDIEALLWAHRF